MICKKRVINNLEEQLKSRKTDNKYHWRRNLIDYSTKIRIVIDLCTLLLSASYHICSVSGINQCTIKGRLLGV